MKIAFVFPGQGSQAAGMGRSLAETWPVARRIFEQADAALGFPLSRLCFEGPDEELRLTENTQPALLTVSVAAFEVLREQGIEPEIVAGHSLGEYSALVAARAIAFEDAVRLVRQRGRFMQEAVPAGVGAMAALLRLPEGKLSEILAQAQKYAKAVDGKECVLRASPEVAKEMKSTENKYLEEIEEILGRPVLVVADQLDNAGIGSTGGRKKRLTEFRLESAKLVFG